MKLIKSLIFFTLLSGPSAFACINFGGYYGQYAGSSFYIKQTGCKSVQIRGTEPGTNFILGYAGELPVDGKEYGFDLIDDNTYAMAKNGSSGSVRFKAQFNQDTLELSKIESGQDALSSKVYSFKLMGNDMSLTTKGKNFSGGDYSQTHSVQKNFREYLKNYDFNGQFAFSIIHGLRQDQVAPLINDFEEITDPNHYYAPMTFTTNKGICPVNPNPTGNFCFIEIEKGIEQYKSLATLNILNIKTNISMEEAANELNRLHFEGHLGAIMGADSCSTRSSVDGEFCVVLAK